MHHKLEDGMQIRQFTYKEFEPLYNERIMVDFPKFERRPLSSIRKLYQKEQYRCIVLERDGILAYAAFIYDKGIESVLLDYFAVDSSLRGSGIGSYFISVLQECWNKDGIILECEVPDQASSPKEEAIRARRIAFYERCGAIVTDYRWRAFGVDYHILWLPLISSANMANIEEDLMQLYQYGMPKLLCSMFTRLSKRSKV